MFNAGTVPFYRYFNGREHFYTTNIHEIGTGTHGKLGKLGKQCYTSEGTAGYIHDTQDSGTIPLYRYFNGHNHFYTTNSDEIGTTVHGVTGKHGYKSEGIAGYCYPHQLYKADGNKALYRAYNGEHFYTTNLDEMISAVKGSYGFEGIACYIG